jgi:adenosylmethionine-8-amino-7-oxononanoate aminotransferase
MASSPITTSTEPEQKNDKSMPAALRPTSILHRTPWRPPVAVSGQGCYITLEDGRKVIDGVGGAAVACIGSGHPEPLKAIKEQVNKVSCEFMPSIVEHGNNVNWIYA